jgi:hypothetical protein
MRRAVVHHRAEPMSGDTLQCAICGGKPVADSSCYLIVDKRCEHRLKVVSWAGQLRCPDAVFVACGTTHLRELVIRWVAAEDLETALAGRRPTSFQAGLVSNGAQP